MNARIADLTTIPLSALVALARLLSTYASRLNFYHRRQTIATKTASRYQPNHLVVIRNYKNDREKSQLIIDSIPINFPNASRKSKPIWGETLVVDAYPSAMIAAKSSENEGVWCRLMAVADKDMIISPPDGFCNLIHNVSTECFFPFLL